MKIIVATLLSLSASVAIAQVPEPEYNPLPRIQVVGVEVDNGPRLAAVQPRASLKIKMNSCARQSLDVNIQKDGRKLLVEVKMARGSIDCFGDTVPYEYDLQISSDYRQEDVVVLNPVEVISRR